MRSGKMMEEEKGQDNFPVKLKDMEAYEKIFSSNTEFYSSFSPDIIQDSIIMNL
jgi:hypothetical protein